MVNPIPDGAGRTAADRDAGDPVQRVLATIQLRATAWATVEGFLRQQHPDWSAERVCDATRERFVDSTR